MLVWTSPPSALIHRLLLTAALLATWHSTSIAVDAIKCYSCANDFIVWQWRHFFLKRNYDISTSDPECTSRDYISDLYQNCHSTCFVFYLNGTNKQTGHTTVLGVGRGCSANFLTDDQHLHLGLGAHSRPSHVGEYLPHDFDQFDITEHWCFCATEKCNSEECFSSPFGSREYASSYIAKRLQYSTYSHNPWKYRNSGPTATNVALAAATAWSLLFVYKLPSLLL